MTTSTATPQAATPAPLSTALKRATADLHTRAEKHPVQARMVGGRATREEYAAFLVQMAALHTRFESALRTIVADVPALSGVVQPHHFRENAAKADLRALEHPPGTKEPVPATTRFCERLDALSKNAPVSLLGVLYVLEGATNGGRFIAAVVRPALGLSEGIGTAYLDPHSQRQQERWSEFKTLVDEQALTSTQQDSIIAAACETFKAVYDILEDLNSTGPVERA